MVKLYCASITQKGNNLDENIKFSYCDFNTNTILAINPTKTQIRNWDFKEMDMKNPNIFLPTPILDWIAESLDVINYEKLIKNKKYLKQGKESLKKNLMEELDNIRKERYNVSGDTNIILDGGV